MLTRWDPFVDFARLSNDLFSFTEPRIAVRNGAAQTRFVPAVDVVEERDAILVTAELPGFKPEEVKIDFEKNVLTLSGERKIEKKSEEKVGFRRIERSHGAFARSFVLPDTVDGEKIEASLDSGLLTVRVPKRPSAEPRKIQIKARA